MHISIQIYLITHFPLQVSVVLNAPIDDLQQLHYQLKETLCVSSYNKKNTNFNITSRFMVSSKNFKII